MGWKSGQGLVVQLIDRSGKPDRDIDAMVDEIRQVIQKYGFVVKSWDDDQFYNEIMYERLCTDKNATKK